MAKVLDMALAEEGISEERRAQLQTLKDSGLLSQKEEAVNQTTAKKIDEYLTKEIAKSIRAGRLSKQSWKIKTPQSS